MRLSMRYTKVLILALRR